MSRRLLLVLVILAAILLLGIWTGRRAGGGLETVAPGSEEAEVVEASLDTAGWFVPESLGPLSWLVLSTSVSEVERRPGSCTQMPVRAGREGRLDEYRVEITARTLFALPLRSYTVTCGGRSIVVG